MALRKVFSRRSLKVGSTAMTPRRWMLWANSWMKMLSVA